MTTTTKVTLALLILIGYAFFSAVEVFADEPEYVRTFSSMGRATYTEKVWTAPDTHETTVTPTTPELLPLVPLYACTGDAYGIVSCVLVGWADPNEPEL